MKTFCSILLFSAVLQGAAITGDPLKGALLFSSQGCIECHSVNGEGGKVAPDLGRQTDRGFTPAQLASTMWNHAPTMWQAMAKGNLKPPPLSLQDSDNLFAFFFYTRFFEKPGDAGRGKRLFEVKQCATCHKTGSETAKPVGEWTATGNPIVLAEAMWNHAGGMRSELNRLGLAWPSLSAQELTDILVYARSQRHGALTVQSFNLTAPERGEVLYKDKGCATCHQGPMLLRERLKTRTLTEVAADFWNHAPRMSSAMLFRDSPMVFKEGEMSELLTWMWAQDYFGGVGNAARGRRVYQAKHCGQCHAATGPAGEFSSIRMTTVLWQHGPAMLVQMREKKIPWPRFRTQEMQDLIAFLTVKQ